MVRKAYKKPHELGGDACVYGDKYVDGTHDVNVLPEKAEVYDNLPVFPKVPLSVNVLNKPGGDQPQRFVPARLAVAIPFLDQRGGNPIRMMDKVIALSAISA